jgi:hypothetical protein
LADAAILQGLPDALDLYHIYTAANDHDLKPSIPEIL